MTIKNTPLIPSERIERSILFIRGHKVMLDTDLAALYGTTTKRLNEQVKRNRRRFPDDFMFQLTSEEKTEVVANCDHLHKLKFSPALPYAFTEHGTVMLASVLNTPIAVNASTQVVRTFIQMRQLLSSQSGFMRKILEMEKKYDRQFVIVFDAIKQLMTPPNPTHRKIGFRKE